MEKCLEIALRLAEDSMMQRKQLEEQLRLQQEKQFRVSEADDESAIEKEMEAAKELTEVKEEVDALKDLNQVLIVKEKNANDELCAARKELIDCLSTDERDSTGVKTVGGRGKRKHYETDTIGVKRMGELDSEPFYAAAMMKDSGNTAIVKATTTCSIYESLLRNPHWNPFKIITNEDGHVVEEIIDDEDEDLECLKREHGGEVYEAVTKALIEVKEYNASGRFPVKELWNFQEDRRATLQEGIAFVAKHKRSKTSRR
ncbi:XH/XS domain-containing protein [Euphorbia peplus]|nr:XH/XS domain-containing protein [Euphorbia peplus]